jgi:hypothetical protein
MGGPVTANAHALGLQFTNLRSVEECGLVKPGRTYKKGRLQTTLQQGGKNDFAIRGIPVVNCQFHSWAPRYEIKNSLKEIPIEPAIALVIVDVPGEWADAMEIKDELEH